MLPKCLLSTDRWRASATSLGSQCQCLTTDFSRAQSESGAAQCCTHTSPNRGCYNYSGIYWMLGGLWVFLFFKPHSSPSSQRCLIQDNVSICKRAAADLIIFQNLVFNPPKEELHMHELNTLKVLNVMWDLDSSHEIFREVCSPVNLGTSFAFLHVPQVPVISGNVDLKSHIWLDWLITCVVMINLPNLSLLWTFN